MNSNLLRGKIVEKGLNLKQFSYKTGIKKSALYRKLAGISEFNRKEIEIMAKELNLDKEQIYNIFFANKVS